MEINNKFYRVEVFSIQPIIDSKIQKEINDSIDNLIKDIKSEKVNIISENEKSKIIYEIDKYREKILLIFKSGFSETEELIKNRYLEYNNSNNAIKNRIPKILMENVLDNMFKDLKVNNENIGEAKSYIIDRGIFIKSLLNSDVLDDEKVLKLIRYSEQDKENEYNEKY